MNFEIMYVFVYIVIGLTRQKVNLVWKQRHASIQCNEVAYLRAESETAEASFLKARASFAFVNFKLWLRSLKISKQHMMDKITPIIIGHCRSMPKLSRRKYGVATGILLSLYTI